MKITPDAGQELLKPAADGKWEPMIKIGPLDAMTTSPAGFDKTGEMLYFIDSRDRNTAALTTIDLKTGKQTLLAEDARADIGGVLAHPTEKTHPGGQLHLRRAPSGRFSTRRSSPTSTT